jgi:hypothetical protein
MSNKLNLTRKLYIFDEVKYTLLNNLTFKNCDFIECIFWSYELFYSGFVDELCEILFEIYYKFYAIKYPKYESKLNIKLNKKNINSILYVVNLLYYTPKITTDIFEIYQKTPKSINKVYLIDHKNFKFLETLNIDHTYYKFVAAIHKNNFTNIMYYIKNNTFDNYNELYDSVKKYFNIVKKIKLENKSLDSIHYSDKYLIIVSLICYLKSDISNINKRKIFRKFDKSQFKNKLDKFKMISGNKNYRILESNPLYHISKNIGCFPLTRFQFKNIKNEVRYHWDYHCSSSPIWLERLNKYKFKIDDSKKSVIFENVDEEEEFYETFDYEFDEQSNELQECIIPGIKHNTINNWIEQLKKLIK